MTSDEQVADEVYQRWRTYELQKQCDAGNMARRFDVLDKLKARYAQSIGCDGGPTVDVLTRAAIEEIEWLRAVAYGRLTRVACPHCENQGRVDFNSIIWC